MNSSELIVNQQRHRQEPIKFILRSNMSSLRSLNQKISTANTRIAVMTSAQQAGSDLFKLIAVLNILVRYLTP